MSDDSRDSIRRAIFDALDSQLADNSPPEARATLDRLKEEGHSHDEAMDLIACVLAHEIFSALKSDRPADHASYVANLARLPDLPEQ